ncbi:MAG: DNA alkylation repair protein [Oscillospiraceae bacterium]|nr:DNA alkylation repair protein [Oscillospiraceae bacterium]
MTKNIREELLLLADEGYREFHARLMPTVDKDKIIGIRTPVLRGYAKSIKGTAAADEFLKQLPHRYYEENNLHAMLIEGIKDADRQASELERLLPYVDNWGTCDLIRPKALFKENELLLCKIREWLKSEHTYTVRFGMGMLLVRFLDEDFSPEFLSLVAEVKSEEYYIRMMQAWYFATAIAKQWDSAVCYLKDNKLEKWTHNKTIQKACESYRITPEQKAFLKGLKQK